LGLWLLALALKVWPWPKPLQTTKFTINFYPLEHGDWSEVRFKIHVPYLLTVGNRGLVRVLGNKNRISLLFIVIICILGWPWPWDFDLGLDSVWPWPWSVGLGLECSGLNITKSPTH